MDVLAIILACSLHPDDALVRTLVDVQSGGNVYFVGDLATLKTNDGLTSAQGALEFAERLQRHGGRPAVGLLGIPLEWAARYGRSPIELFDACTNIAMGTAAFVDFERRCSPAAARGAKGRRPGHSLGRSPALVPAARRTCVLTLFARDLGVTGAPAAILRRLAPVSDPARHDSGDAPPERSGIFVGAEDGARGGAARVLVEPAPRTPAPR